LLGRFNAVIHFAGLKAMGESVRMPLHYYNNNIIRTLNLLDAMTRHGCKQVKKSYCFFFSRCSPFFFFFFRELSVSCDEDDDGDDMACMQLVD
jgi:hypothetical protein